MCRARWRRSASSVSKSAGDVRLREGAAKAQAVQKDDTSDERAELDLPDRQKSAVHRVPSP